MENVFSLGTDKGFQSKPDYPCINKGKGHCPIVGLIPSYINIGGVETLSTEDDITFD